MDIPTGFQLDPQSGLYYKEEGSWEDGAPVRLVTWLDPQSGATQQVRYPIAEESPVISEAATSFTFSIPEGFAPYPGSDLYFQTENCMENGVPIQRVTYYNPAEDSYHQVDYPTEALPEPGQVTEEETVLELAPIETEEEPPHTEPMKTLPLDEEDVLLPPPPEPLLVPTGLPEQNPYAAQPAQAFDATEASPIPSGWQTTIEQEPYTGPGVPQPLPEKKSKPAIITAIAGMLVLVAIGVCGWQFGWFGGQSVPVDGVAASQPPASSGADVSSAPSSTPVPEESSDVSNESEGAKPDAIHKPGMVQDVGVEVVYQSAKTADITLTNIPFQSSYPTKISGWPTKRNLILYQWCVAVGDYSFALLYSCEEDDEDKTITMDDMRGLMFDLKEGGTGEIYSIECSITEDTVTFHNITFPEDRGVDFSSPETVYTVNVLEGKYFDQKQTQATITASESKETEKGERIIVPRLAENIGVEVNPHSKTIADITLTNVTFQSGYPTKISGVPNVRGQILYAWLVTVNDYTVSLLYICKEDGEDRTIKVSDMRACVLDQTEENEEGIIPIEHSVNGDRITFYNITVPESRGIDFSSPETIYQIEVLQGLNFGEKQTQADVASSSKPGLSQETLRTRYRYVSEATDMQVVLELQQDEGRFQMDADLGGTTYHIPGTFTVQAGGIVTLKSDGTAPIFKGEAQLQLEENGGLRLESPENIGVLPAGGVLRPD